MINDLPDILLRHRRTVGLAAILLEPPVAAPAGGEAEAAAETGAGLG